MKQKNLLTTMLLLFALVVGSTSAWADTWEKANSIQVGDVIVLVTENSNNSTVKKELTSFSSGSTIFGVGTDYETTPAGTYTFTVEEGNTEGTFAFKHDNVYLNWNTGNSLNTNGTLSNNTSWNVSFEGTVATITNASTPARQIWWNVSSPRFACYTGKSEGDSYYITTIYKKVTGVDPVGPAATVGEYVKVTDTDNLTTGQYLIVNEDASVAYKGSAPADASNNVIDVTVSENKISVTETTTANEFTLNMTDGSIKAATGKYVGRTANSTGINVSDDAIAHSISITASGDATIKSTSNNYLLRYNGTSGQNRFRYYSGTSVNPVQLYKYVPGASANTFDVPIGATGYKTLVSTVDFETPEGVTAYIVTTADFDNSVITLTKVNQIPADEPVILKGTANTSPTLNVTTMKDDDKTSVSNDNLLEKSTASTGNGVYVLAKVGEDVGFYQWTGGSLGAGRVYLPAPQGDGARAFLAFIFEDESTGIAEIEAVKSVENGKFYNLNGQQVAQPTKGLYIVNGKKYIVK